MTLPPPIRRGASAIQTTVGLFMILYALAFLQRPQIGIFNYLVTIVHIPPLVIVYLFLFSGLFFIGVNLTRHHVTFLPGFFLKAPLLLYAASSIPFVFATPAASFLASLGHVAFAALAMIGLIRQERRDAF